MLCEAASIENGKLFLLGAGLATWWLPGFPAEATPVLAVVVEADRDLDVGEVAFSLKAVTAEGVEVLDGMIRVAITGPATPGVPWVLPMIATMKIPVTEPTQLNIVIANEAGIDARLPLMVMARPPG
jgi:hypothetical protein